MEHEIQEISEREQRRLGQDLHDGLGQSMTGIAFLAKVLQQKLQAKAVEEAEAAGNIASLINEALSQTRRLSRGLCPVVLDSNDIEAALEQLAENLRTLFSVSCELHCDPEIKITDNAVAVHLYRIAQEAATNAIKHGRAKNICLSLTANNSRVILKIKDDGAGFPRRAQRQRHGSARHAPSGADDWRHSQHAPAQGRRHHRHLLDPQDPCDEKEIGLLKLPLPQKQERLRHPIRGGPVVETG